MFATMCVFFEQKLTVRQSHDPGNCSQSNHGEIILVKDRENKDTILVCTEDNGNYAWKTTDSKFHICFNVLTARDNLCIYGTNTMLLFAMFEKSTY